MPPSSSAAGKAEQVPLISSANPMSAGDKKTANLPPVGSLMQSRVVTLTLAVGLIILLFDKADITSTVGRIRSRNKPPTADVEPVQICSEEGIAQLTDALRSDPETFGLRPYWIGRGDKSDENIPASSDNIFPGLDDNLLSQTFRGRRIIFFGDSTLYYFDQGLHRLLKLTSRESLAKLSSVDMSQGNAAVNATIDFNAITTRLGDGTYVSGKFTVGRADPGSTCDLSPNHDKIRYKCKFVGSCQIVIANFGLHWLHFWGKGRTLSACETVRWIQYEEWMEEMIQLAQSVGATTLLFKTMNRICAEKYTGEFEVANRLYEQGDKILLGACFRDLRKEITTDINDNAIKDYCRNATFNERGSEHLNERIIRFVQERRENAGLTLGIFNDHDVETCKYTEESDGRHYKSLNLVRIRLLGNVLKCVTED